MWKWCFNFVDSVSCQSCSSASNLPTSSFLFLKCSFSFLFHFPFIMIVIVYDKFEVCYSLDRCSPYLNRGQSFMCFKSFTQTHTHTYVHMLLHILLKKDINYFLLLVIKLTIIYIYIYIYILKLKSKKRRNIKVILCI